MALGLIDKFNGELRADPSLALPTQVPIPRAKSGPLHRVEFTVEFVGPYSIPAGSASRLLDQDWYLALQSPKIWSMSAADNQWVPLVGTSVGSYDSLAICWPYLREDSRLTGAVADQLWRASAPFADAVRRRPAALPPPEDVDRLAEELQAIRDHLNIGVTFVFSPSSGWVSEREVWITAANMGLTFAPQGAFEYRVNGTELPLFSVTPIGENDQFSLGSVLDNAVHSGLLIGFNVPRCPNPAKAIEGALRFGRLLCERFGGRLINDEDQFVDAATAARSIEQVQQAAITLTKTEIIPGSSEAVALFPLEV